MPSDLQSLSTIRVPRFRTNRYPGFFGEGVEPTAPPPSPKTPAVSRLAAVAPAFDDRGGMGPSPEGGIGSLSGVGAAPGTSAVGPSTPGLGLGFDVSLSDVANALGTIGIGLGLGAAVAGPAAPALGLASMAATALGAVIGMFSAEPDVTDPEAEATDPEAEATAAPDEGLGLGSIGVSDAAAAEAAAAAAAASEAESESAAADAAAAAAADAAAAAEGPGVEGAEGSDAAEGGVGSDSGGEGEGEGEGSSGGVGGEASGPGGASGPSGDAGVGAGGEAGTDGDGAAGGGAGGCYISTATAQNADDPVTAQGDLATLRQWRDDVLNKSPMGRMATQVYYQTAPQIASDISNRPDAPAVYTDLHRNYIRPAVDAIRGGDDARAMSMYTQMVQAAKGAAQAPHGGEQSPEFIQTTQPSGLASVRAPGS